MACAGVVLPTPGTPSIRRCPRASTETRARRTISSLPRMTFFSSFSRREARSEAAITVSGDMKAILLCGDERALVTLVTRAEARLINFNVLRGHEWPLFHIRSGYRFILAS